MNIDTKKVTQNPTTNLLVNEDSYLNVLLSNIATISMTNSNRRADSRIRILAQDPIVLAIRLSLEVTLCVCVWMCMYAWTKRPSHLLYSVICFSVTISH